MRITNSIMQSNSLTNINGNKELLDRLNTQMSTKKKITKPSDDPVVAIRALRLRTNVSQVTQYYEKNTADANSWLDLTESALDSVKKQLTSLKEQSQKGATGTMETSNQLVTIENMQAIVDEVYATGNADCAGRSLFTGFRTDSKLTFQENETITYNITEQLDVSSLENITNVGISDLMDFSKANYATLGVTEQAVNSSEVHRIRLAYSSGDSAPAAVAPTISYYDGTGTLQSVTANITSINSATSPYTSVAAGQVNYIPETGELILSDSINSALNAVKDNVATANVNEGEIRVNYTKSSWEKGDLRPEHYFSCVSNPGVAGKEISYNADFLTGGEKQNILFDVGTNQTIQINTTADESFSHDIGRDVEELKRQTELLSSIDTIVNDLDKLIEGGTLTEAQQTVAKEKLAAAEKAQTLQKDKVQKMFGSAITSIQGYLDEANLAATNCGSRGSRLELIQNRLKSQQTNFKTLASENEDADVTEVAIQLGSAELSYEAALMATGKIAQTSLLNFI